MSTMQVFYMDLAQTLAAGERNTELPAQKKDTPTAVLRDTYHEKLAQLTRLTLTELNSNREEMAWSAWW